VREISIDHIVGNVHYTVGQDRAALGNDKLNLPPVLQRWIVLDVVSDPFSFTQEKINDIEAKYGPIKNKGLSTEGRILPRNTIIAYPPKNAYNPDPKAMFLYPFFPSAIALPCRPGEHVWVLFEILQPENQAMDAESERAYWLCSVVQEGHVDDVNHSHQARSDDVDFIISNNDIKNGEVRQGGASAKQRVEATKPQYHFKNGKYIGGERSLDVTFADLFISTSTSGPAGDEYEQILRTSEGSKNSVYESVPRFKKRPGDIALEGSNNSLIVLGRDRDGPLFEGSGKSAGTIDIVAGRGQTTMTGGNVIINDLGNQELAKDGSSLVPDEGNPDFKTDKSRIYVSQNTNVDDNFGISEYNEENLKIEDSDEGNPGIIIKSDKIRLIARSDLQIIVTNNVEEAEDDPKKFASITIKSNGDIVFKPSDMGYIKLGGDDADRGIVCSAFPVTKTNGGIEGGHLLTSMGGLFAGAAFATPECNQPIPTPGPTAGIFANKVLIK